MKNTSLLSCSLKLSELNYRLAGIERIKQFSLTVSAGNKIALLGLNGAGKSTLIRLLVGELPPSSGAVKYSSEQHTISPNDLMFKQELGYQADTMLAIAELDGLAYLKLCGSFKQIKADHLDTQIKSVSQQWQITDLLHKPMTSLSKGNLQKLSIAQAFLGKPKWLFFDEPCQSLDPVEQDRFNQNILALREFNSCMVSTHNVDHALEIADEIILLHQGELAHHFSFGEQSRMLMVIKDMNDDQLDLFEKALAKFFSNIEHRFKRLYSLIPNEQDAGVVLPNFIQQWSNQLEFALPEKQALMPLFRLLASGELKLEKKPNSLTNGGVE